MPAKQKKEPAVSAAAKKKARLTAAEPEKPAPLAAEESTEPSATDVPTPTVVKVEGVEATEDVEATDNLGRATGSAGRTATSTRPVPPAKMSVVTKEGIAQLFAPPRAMAAIVVDAERHAQ